MVVIRAAIGYTVLQHIRCLCLHTGAMYVGLQVLQRLLAASAGKEGLRRQRPCGVRPTGEINLIFNVLQLKCGKCEENFEKMTTNGCNSCRDWL